MTKNGQSAKLRPADRPPHILMVWEFSFFGLWSPSGSLANATASDGSATRFTRHPVLVRSTSLCQIGPTCSPSETRIIAHKLFKPAPEGASSTHRRTWCRGSGTQKEGKGVVERAVMRFSTRRQDLAIRQTDPGHLAKFGCVTCSIAHRF